MSYLQYARKEKYMALCYTPVYDYPQHTLKVVYNNTRSFKKYYDDIRINDNILGADVAIFAETRFSGNEQLQNYALKGFQVTSLPHEVTGKKYHGLLLYVRNELHLISGKTFPGNKCEAIFVKLLKNGQTHVIVGLYISPGIDSKTLGDFLNEVMTYTIQHDGIVTLIGDFNIDASDSVNNSLFAKMKQIYNLTQHMSKSTTIHQTTIDLIMSNAANIITGSIYAYWSDHYIIYCVL